MAGVAIWTTGCVTGPPVVLDLVTALPEAETYTETALLDVGEAGARPLLGDGWLDDERWAGRPDESFVWAVGDSASFRFQVYERRDLVMLVRGRPNPAEGAHATTSLGIEVNGRVVARAEVEPGWNTYRATLPRQIVVAGDNHARLIFGDGAGAEALDRRLAVERVEIERTVVTYPVRRELGAPALVMPYLSGVWYRVEPPPGARLLVREIAAFGPHEGDPPGLLEVVLETADGETRRARALAGESLDLEIEGDVTRIGLLSVPSGDPHTRSERERGEEAVGLLLRRPALVGG